MQACGSRISRRTGLYSFPMLKHTAVKIAGHAGIKGSRSSHQNVNPTPAHSWFLASYSLECHSDDRREEESMRSPPATVAKAPSHQSRQGHSDDRRKEESTRSPSATVAK